MFGSRWYAEAPRVEEYGMVAVFVDMYGNRWDLIQHKGEFGLQSLSRQS